MPAPPSPKKRGAPYTDPFVNEKQWAKKDPSGSPKECHFVTQISGDYSVLSYKEHTPLMLNEVLRGRDNLMIVLLVVALYCTIVVLEGRRLIVIFVRWLGLPTTDKSVIYKVSIYKYPETNSCS